ncbi:MAG: nudF, partial [Marmoricola sp.]|nr:nudF [Marmoricola sp.]
ERELREEVELQASSWRLLMTLNPSAGITTELHHVYLARGLSHVSRGDFEMHAEEAELEQLWVPVDELVDAVLDGRICESPMAAAVLAYDVLRRRGDL